MWYWSRAKLLVSCLPARKSLSLFSARSRSIHFWRSDVTMLYLYEDEFKNVSTPLWYIGGTRKLIFLLSSGSFQKSMSMDSRSWRSFSTASWSESITTEYNLWFTKRTASSVHRSSLSKCSPEINETSAKRMTVSNIFCTSRECQWHSILTTLLFPETSSPWSDSCWASWVKLSTQSWNNFFVYRFHLKQVQGFSQRNSTKP